MTNQPQPVTTTSADITQDRLDQLRRLLPEAFTEGRVDFDKLRAALGHHVDDSPERYAFTWAGKRNAIRLAPAPDGGFHLEVQLKLRDPVQEWRGWQYEPDGANIRHEWVKAYHFPILDAAKARFYQVVLPHRAEFMHAGSFPGGYTRTTAQKLAATTLPAFDPGVDLTPLLELDAELAQVEDTLARTDGLIDQIVYRLYGLTVEEIGIVAGDGG
jgi:hypothetical protein